MSSALSIVQEYFPEVTDVVDGEVDIQVSVTKKDTTHAKVRNHSACAFAMACKRMFNAEGVNGVIVAVKTAYLVRGNLAVRYKLPESVSREVVSFDRGAIFDEGVYHMNAPAKSSKLGARKGRNNKGVTKGTGKKTMFTKHDTRGIRVALGSKKNPTGVRT